MDRSKHSFSLVVNEAVHSFRLLEALRNGNQKVLEPFLNATDQSKGPLKELTSPLHLAVRCAEYDTIKMVLGNKHIDVNAIESQFGNTPLHLASNIGRSDVVDLFLAHPNTNDTIRNIDGQDPLDVAQTIEIIKLFQISRAQVNFAFQDLFERWEKDQTTNSDEIKAFLNQGRIGIVDLTVKSRTTGSTLLHEAVRRKDNALIELAVRKGADVFVRNKRGKRVLETTKDEKIKALLQQLSNADAAIAASAAMPGLPPTFRGYLGKWTNYARGYKNRWFVLESGILSYYHTQEEEGKQSRGSTNLRYAKIRADPSDKHRFEVIADPPSGSLKSSSRLYLRGSHPVERARWLQVLQQTADFFDLERSNSRSESIHSIGTGKDVGGPSANVPAGTPFQVPSRSTTPFRGIPSPGPIFTRPNLNLAASASSMAPIKTQSSRVSSDKFAEPKTPFEAKSPIELKSPQNIEEKTPSIMTKDSHTPSEEQADLDLSQSATLPFQNELPLVSNSLRTQLELSQQLIPSIQSADAQTAAKESLQTSLSLFADFETMVSEREAYLTRRYEQEIQAKRLWEENIKTLAQQYADMEAQLQEAAQENAKRRKALREVREAYGASASGLNSPLASPGLHPATPSRGPLGVAAGATAGAAVGAATVSAFGKNQTGPVRPSAQRGALQFDKSGIPSSGSSSRQGIQSFPSSTDLDELDDADDEFFDAIESGNLPGLRVEDATTDTGVRAVEGQPKDTITKKNSQLWAGVQPYVKLRDCMPIGKDDRPSMSLWSILKNNIGKDLTKISFPVSFNEPTSMLQRMAEDMTYASLLDTAVRQSDSTLRMAFVAAFACSNYVTTLGRVAKPFNPMLGETFEFLSIDGPCKYRYQSEQVSHHPPVSACVAESLSEDGIHTRPAWEYTGCVQAQSKFLGRTFEIRPTGMAHVRLVVNGQVEHYSFKKVTTSVSGFVTGSPTIDHYGDMNIKCHTTGDECIMTFKPRGWRSSGQHELKGSVTSGKDGSTAWDIAGRWSSQIVARRTSASVPTQLDPDGNTESLSSDPTTLDEGMPETVLLWKYHPQPPGPFCLTPYAILLNDLPEGLHDWLPPTDCRLRPDLRLFERGQYDEADVMKRNLEEYQRATRRKREAGELPSHQPKFFTKVIEPETQADYWQPHRSSESELSSTGEKVPEYWSRRQQRNWQNVERIFGEYTA